MRHLSQEVGLLAELVIDPSSGRLLVPLAGGFERSYSRLRRALWAIDIAPVTSRADAYLRMASATVVEPVGLMTRRSLKTGRQKAFSER